MTEKPTEIFFFSTLHNGYEFLSNFFRSPMVIDGIFYQTMEAYYQSEKVDLKSEKRTNHDPQYEKMRIARCVYGIDALRYGRNLDKDMLRKNWDKVKVDIMLNGLRHKFGQNS